MMDDPFAQMALEHERVADELELAVRHLRVTAKHYREREVPRACAHVVAATGHVVQARAWLEQLAVRHAAKARTE